jgi:DNA polymerase III delta subunit
MAGDRAINSKQFRRELSSVPPHGIYIFTGEEEGEKEKVIEVMIDKMLPDRNLRMYSAGRFHIENDELMDAADFALSGSMFSAKKICVLLNFDGLQNSKRNTELLSDLFGGLPDASTLIITVSGNSAPGLIPPDVLKKARVVQFWKFFERDLIEHISGSMRKMGLHFEPRVAPLLVELLGRDIRKIDDAVTRLREMNVTGVITAEMAAGLIQDERDMSIFEFIDLLFTGKMETFRAFSRLLDGGASELFILSMIMRQAGLIEKYHALTSGGLAPEEALKRIRITARNTDGFMEQSRKNPPGRLNGIFPMIYRADYRLKSGPYSGSILSNPILELISAYLLG